MIKINFVIDNLNDEQTLDDIHRDLWDLIEKYPHIRVRYKENGKTSSPLCEIPPFVQDRAA